MENRLVDRQYAIVFLGPVDGELRSAIEETLSDADADTGAALRIRAAHRPCRRSTDVLESSEGLARATRATTTSALGRAIGAELVEEGETPCSAQVSSELVEERSGATIPAVDGAVVVRSWVARLGGRRSRLRAGERSVRRGSPRRVCRQPRCPSWGQRSPMSSRRSSAVPVFNDAAASRASTTSTPRRAGSRSRSSWAEASPATTASRTPPPTESSRRSTPVPVQPIGG